MALRSRTIPISVFVLAFVLQSGFFVNGNIKLKIISIPKFPHYFNIPFNILIRPENEFAKLSMSTLDTFVMRIADGSNKTLDKVIHDYGYKPSIDQPHDGQYMKVSVWEESIDKQTMNISMMFTKLANRQWFEIYNVISTSQEERLKQISGLPPSILFFRSKINLFIPPELSLKLEGNGKQEEAFNLNEEVKAICQVTDSDPKKTPYFTNLEQFNVRTNVLTEKTNTREVEILTVQSNHLKTLNCKAGETKKSVTLKIYHPPTNVRLEPEISGTFENDGRVECQNLDGYPLPRIQWYFISGPPNAQKSYDISPSGKTLHIKVDEISGLRWTFTCQVTDGRSDQVASVNKTISFVIIRKAETIRGELIKEIPKINIQKKKTLILEKQVALLSKQYEIQNKKNIRFQHNHGRLLNEFFELNHLYKKQSKILTELKDKLEKRLDYGEFIWKIDRFTNKRWNVETGVTTKFYSEPFYSHKFGYKLRLVLYPYGIGGVSGNTMEVTAELIPGDYDDILEWPMKQTIKVEIVSQNQTRNAGIAYYINEVPKSFNKPNSVSGEESHPLMRHDNGTPPKDQLFLKCNVMFV